MPDTGLPWEIPYIEPSDLVRDYPAADEAQALAIAAGLSAAGGLVEVKTEILTATQSASVATGANLAVTNLSIAHTLADASNRLILMAYLGVASNSQGRANVGLAIADDGVLIGIGDADGSRDRVGAGGVVDQGGGGSVVTMPSIHLVYSPGDAVEHTYTVRAINVDEGTRTLYINRSVTDNNSTDSFTRGVSVLTLMEIKV
jgi:hypothetical protein